MTSIPLIEQWHTSNQLGECILWDWRTNRVWWTDILGTTLHFRDEAGEVRNIALSQPLCSFGLCEHPTQLVCAFANGFALYDWQHNEIQWLHDIEKLLPDNRMNDGRVDRQGRFWAGSMRMKGHADKGQLYRLDANGPESVLNEIRISNGLCWNQSASAMYFADSDAQVIWRFEFEPDTGVLGRRTVFARTSGREHPDGACVDSEDHLWVAIWGGAKVIRFRPDGQIDNVIETPCLQPTCVCFGGPSLTQLYVSSAWDGLNPSQRDRDHGDVFVYDTPYQGIKETLCHTHSWRTDKNNN